MAKFYGSSVKTGKIGGSVFRIRYGETIENQYQPQVANPNTPKQVEARAKLKLLSQLSAVLAPAIAMPRVGAVSTRNRFTAVNYGAIRYQNGEATINVTAVQLTKSVVGFTEVTVTRGESAIVASVSSGQIVDRVVFVLVSKGADEKLRYADSAVESTATAQGRFSHSFYDIGGVCYVLAYGVRDNTDAARAVFGNMIAPTAEDVAKVITSRVLLETDVTLTETRGVAVPVSA